MPLTKPKKFNQRYKYVKITIKTKIKFLKKVLLEGFSIRDVKIKIVSHPPSLILTIPLLKHSFVSTDPINLHMIWIFRLMKQVPPSTIIRL